MEQSYKEKYEQAIERLKQWDREHPCAGYVLSDRDKFIFPELAESRDEKIKKRITLCLEECVHSDVIRDYEKDECIAWLENIQYTIDHEKREGFHLGYKACLERQTEQKPNPYSGTSFEYNGHTWGMCARDGGVEILMDGNITSRVFPDKNNIIEQKPTDSYCQENCKGFQETGKCFADGECKAKREAEQKPVIKFKTAEESLGISSDEYNKIVDECLFGEQKLTEFERGLFDMLTDISKPCTADCVKSHSEKLLSIARKMIALEQKPEENKGNIEGISPNSAWSEEDEQRLNSCLNILQPKTFVGNTETINTKWLKSLKDRVQPKQEWSEEDKAFLDDILCKLEHDLILNKDEKDWLKSLRPQNRWKPSDVQMSLLQAIINEPKNAASESCQIVLREVLEQLKKLKEE